jgi:hypothetical protein
MEGLASGSAISGPFAGPGRTADWGSRVKDVDYGDALSSERVVAMGMAMAMGEREVRQDKTLRL